MQKINKKYLNIIILLSFLDANCESKRISNHIHPRLASRQRRRVTICKIAFLESSHTPSVYTWQTSLCGCIASPLHMCASMQNAYIYCGRPRKYHKRFHHTATSHIERNWTYGANRCVVVLYSHVCGSRDKQHIT